MVATGGHGKTFDAVSAAAQTAMLNNTLADSRFSFAMKKIFP